MLIEPNYRGHRIEVHAELVDGAWDAVVRIRRTLSEEKPHVVRVTCRKMTAELAERRAAKRAQTQPGATGRPRRALTHENPSAWPLPAR